jgi:hypothetical protein
MTQAVAARERIEGIRGIQPPSIKIYKQIPDNPKIAIVLQMIREKRRRMCQASVPPLKALIHTKTISPH